MGWHNGSRVSFRELHACGSTLQLHLSLLDSVGVRRRSTRWMSSRHLKINSEGSSIRFRCRLGAVPQMAALTILSIRLPLYPKLRIQLISEFSNELVRSVMAGELNLALVTAPLENSQITAVPFALTPLYAALPESHPAAQKEHVALQDLTQDDWILFGRRVHPVIHDAIMDAAGREGISPKNAHDIITAQQAIHLVSERLGVAILTAPTCVGFTAHG